MPVDPLLYCLCEIIQVFGPAVRAVINERFGDGIMSTIDFELGIERKPDPNGDRVVITLDGKFLPYRELWSSLERAMATLLHPLPTDASEIAPVVPWLPVGVDVGGERRPGAGRMSRPHASF